MHERPQHSETLHLTSWNWSNVQSALQELWFSMQMTLDSCGPQSVFLDESFLFYHVICILNVFLHWVFPDRSKGVFADTCQNGSPENTSWSQSDLKYLKYLKHLKCLKHLKHLNLFEVSGIFESYCRSIVPPEISLFHGFVPRGFWMLLVLLCFVVSQSVLPRLHTVPWRAACAACAVPRSIRYGFFRHG